MRIYLLLMCLFSTNMMAMKSAPAPQTIISTFIQNNQFDELKGYLNTYDDEESLQILLNRYYILHKALTHTNVSEKIIDLLLDWGVDTNKATENKWLRTSNTEARSFNQGSTAAHIAITMQHSRNIIQLLKGYGCDFNKKDNFGITAIELASGEYRTKIARYLNDEENVINKDRPKPSLLMEYFKKDCLPGTVKALAVGGSMALLIYYFFYSGAYVWINAADFA